MWFLDHYKNYGVTPTFHFVHSGDFAGDSEFNFYVSYVLTLIKAYSILVCTHIIWFFYPFTLVSGKWEEGMLHLGLRIK